MTTERLCVLCKKPVADDNNATLLSIQAGYSMSSSILFFGYRHLFVTEGCPGSPSRAQYFPGQPLDSRMKKDGSQMYPIQVGAQVRFREALEKLKEGRFWEEN